MKKQNFDHNKEYKNLSEIFNEIKENNENAKIVIQSKQNARLKRQRKKREKKQFQSSTKVKNIKNQHEKDKIQNINSNPSWTKSSNSASTYIYYADKKINWFFIIFLVILIVLWCLFGIKVYTDLSSVNVLDDSLNSSNSNLEYELNRNSINLKNLTSDNSSLKKYKVQVIEEKEIEFETTKNEKNDLPLGEEIVIQEGRNGTEDVSFVRTFEKDTMINELVLERKTTLDFVPKLVDVGTSQFLANIKAHIGDTLYLNSNSPLYSSKEENSNALFEIKEYLDVKLLELVSEDLCKVSFNGIDGYISADKLTSSTVYPAIVEQNRKQKILLKLNNSMPINVSSGLTSNDFKKVLSNLPNDTTSAFKNSYYSFYTAEQNYKVNGIFLVAFMIKETSWGTNIQSLFEKLSIPESEYNNYSFTDSINILAEKLVKDHINPAGISIYGGEYSTGWYYTSPTISGVASSFSTNNSWSIDVYSYMTTLYNLI